ncbi:YoaK family protein [Rhizobium sp. RAF56]|jgi:uncharacterized membrane protein YoaK (UPF0700 family)|uniref:YoaK family protein n=1 Tax=Rhizobium sp. RAF56 TaxID=3233062 RepID=UPI003F9BA37F
MRLTLPVLLSFNGGYVDTAGFLALQGLFTAHVTGNFVTFGASVALGTSGAAAKLLALPVFCIVVILVRLLAHLLGGRSLPVLRTLLVLKVGLLAAAALLASWLGPFATGDSWQAILTGMVLVSAMAIQNAVHRVHLSKAPPTTLMTGTTTQIMIDIADLMLGITPEAKAAWAQRISRMSVAVLSFALGCALAALAFIVVKVSCFLLPPLIAIAGILVHDFSSEEMPA